MKKSTAAYTDTGIWGAKAIKEAKLFGNVDVVAVQKIKIILIPKILQLPNMQHICILQPITPFTERNGKTFLVMISVPLVADMSSDIFSRQLDFNKFDLIYAGAQKNMGAAGVNVVVVNKNILGKVNTAIPTMMDYRNHIEASSLLNTPPVFAIYVCMLTLRWLKKMGGIAEAEKRNDAKAKLFYETTGQFPYLQGHCCKRRPQQNECCICN